MILTVIYGVTTSANSPQQAGSAQIEKSVQSQPVVDGTTHLLAGNPGTYGYWTKGLTVASQPQKRAAVSDALNIDTSIAPLTGKRVYYVLTDQEGGLQLESTGQGRKVPALIVFNYRGRRDSEGRLVSPLVIFRPAFAGGLFQKDEVASDSSRTQGTWDAIQPGDLLN